MNSKELWEMIEKGIQEDTNKPPILDGHDDVSGGSETGPAPETDTLTKPELGGSGEAGGEAETYTEVGGEAGAVTEVQGFVEAGPPGPTPETAQEIVHGADDRVLVSGTTVYPWRTICHLEITAPNGKTYIGTGATIGPRVVLTAGHCVYLHGDGGWARSIRVIAGRNGNGMPYGDAVGTFYHSVKGWTDSHDSDYDYGVIVLPTSKKLGNTVGWMGLANLSFTSLLGLRVNSSGYPGDKPYGTQWWNANVILYVTGRRLYYQIDTMGGQSGSPVWRYKDGQRHIIGVHTTGGSPFNGATRLCEPVFNNLVMWKNAYP